MSGAATPSARLPWHELAALAPCREAVAEDSVLGRTPQRVLEPRSIDEIAAVLKWANAHQAAVGIRGGGTKLEWGNPPRTLDLIMSTRELRTVVEHAAQDLTVTVDPGCTVADLQRALADHKQRLAIDALFSEKATVGGLLATNDSGALRTRFGSLRDLLIGVIAVLADGTIARSGGKVVKNVAGYDLPKLFTGSLGTLGVIAQATFRVHPLPPAVRTLSFRFAGPGAALAGLLALQDSNLVHTSLQLRVVRHSEPELDVRFAGTEAGIEAQVQRTVKMLAGATQVETNPDVWQAREQLWDAGATCIAKITLLPAQIAELCARVEQGNVDWRLVVQAVGTAVLALTGELSQVSTAAARLREYLENSGGALVLLRAPAEVRDHMDAWGNVGSALPLMQRVKHQFDPAGIMNPGRFVGGI